MSTAGCRVVPFRRPSAEERDTTFCGGLIARLLHEADPTKQWKISESGYAERKYWNHYMAAYDDALSRCSTLQAP
jgi:polyphosphate kinase 2 (PPK2 family)